MNKKKIFLGAGAVVLLAAAAFAGKVTKKFLTANTIFIAGAGGSCKVIVSSAATNKFVTLAVGNKQAQINTNASTTLRGLYATSTCTSKQVYLVP